jgi:branched-chain amino acid transport system substrate-binding protein
MKMSAPILAASCVFAVAAHAQVAERPVRIGILTDMSSVYADIGGHGSVEAAQMAVIDAGAKALNPDVRARRDAERRSSH